MKILIIENKKKKFARTANLRKERFCIKLKIFPSSKRSRLVQLSLNDISTKMVHIALKIHENKWAEINAGKE